MDEGECKYQLRNCTLPQGSPQLFFERKIRYILASRTSRLSTYISNRTFQLLKTPAEDRSTGGQKSRC